MIGRFLIVPVALALLTGAGVAGGVMRFASAAPADTRPGGYDSGPMSEDRRIVHVLNRITLGPRPGDVARVRAIGLERYIEQQLNPDGIADPVVDRLLRDLPTLHLSIPDLLREYPKPDPALREQVASGQMSRQEMMERYPPEKRPGRILAELEAAKMVRAVMGERQLEEVMVDFWFNHFNVFAPKGAVLWYVTAYERDAIRPHALGKFRDLVRATARHPAMLFYLDNWLSARPDFTIPFGQNAGKRAGLNENYARELMELHTLGVDGGYTQKDVTEVARAFTGWTIQGPRAGGGFVFRRALHDPGEKVILGKRIPAGGGEEDGERVIEILTRHPATARLIAGKLVRRFVSDDPPPALVERVATMYRDTDGGIRAMLRTILTAPEFYAAAAYRAKVKKPFDFVVSAVRALGGAVEARGGFALARATAEIGEPLYRAEPPTGYADRASEWVNPGALLARMNFALGLTQQRFPGVHVDLARLTADVPRDSRAMLERFLATVLQNQVSEETRAALAAQLIDPRPARPAAIDPAWSNTGVETLTALVIASPEFQRR